MSDHRDTVVVKDGGSSSSLILAIIVVLVVLAGAWYFLMGPGAGSTTQPTDVNINVELPSVAPVAS
jgi:flagellar basal body-associated protein FliL